MNTPRFPLALAFIFGLLTQPAFAQMSMDAAKRAVLYDEIRRRIGARADPTVRRHWCAILHVARRKARTG